MTVVSNTAPAPLPQADAASQKLDQAKNDSFLALLNIGNVSADNAASPSAAPAEKPERHADARTPAPQPAARTEKPRATREENDAQAPARDTAPRAEKPAVEKASPVKTLHDESKEAQSADKLKAADNTATTGDETGDIAARQKKIRAQLSDQLDNIGLILQALINALTTQAPATPAADASAPADATVTAQTDASTATAPLPAVPALPSIADLLGSLAAATPAITADTATPETQAPTAETTLTATTGQIEIPASLLTQSDPQEDIALLKDIQSLLSQLRNNVQPADAAAAPAPVAATPASAVPTAAAGLVVQVQTPTPAPKDPQALIGQLRQDINALAERIAQLPAGETATVTITPAEKPATPETLLPAAPVAAAAQAPEAPKPQNLLTFLKDSIADVRERLQALQQDNEAIYAQTKTIQQQFEAAQTTKTPNVKITAETAAPAVVATAAATPQPVQSSVPTSAQPVSIVIALNPQESGGQTGQQQTPDQGQNQQSAAPVASTQTTANGVARTESQSFARVVARASLPLAEQVAVQVKNAVSDGTSRIRIQLDPGDLGKIDIRLSVDADGKTGLSIMVDSKNTLDLLQRDAAALTRTLNEAGLSADGNSLSFNLRGGDQQQHNSSQQAATTYKKTQPEEEEPALLNIISRNQALNLSDGLDIKI